MKNKLLYTLGFLSCFGWGLSWAANSPSESFQPWRPIISVGGGVSSVFNVGRFQNFPIITPTTDSFYTYVPQSSTQIEGLFEIFLGTEQALFGKWRLQSGLAYDQTGSYTNTGTLTQGADLPSSNQYNYQFKIVTHQILAQIKAIYPYRNKLNPYFLLGLGGAVNTSSNFSTTVPPFLTFTREYANDTVGSFAYRVGFGLDIELGNHLRTGIMYRFADLGNYRLGNTNINGVAVPGTLSQNNIYANEMLIQLTYVL